MQIVRSIADIATVVDPELRRLIQLSVDQLLGQFNPGEYSLEELCQYIVVEPSDDIAGAIEAIDGPLGRSLLDAMTELVFEHTNWYQLIFIVDDDGFGIELFVPKTDGIDPRLLAMCKA